MIVYPILPSGLFWNSSFFWCICCFGTLHSCSVCLLATNHLPLEQGPDELRIKTAFPASTQYSLDHIPLYRIKHVHVKNNDPSQGSDFTA